jgi:murein DD-endopeptidase MepM/ murein hydrolase activator NlpD
VAVRHSTGRHRTRSADVRPPAWDWTFETDGALALDRDDLWIESALSSPVLPQPQHRPHRRPLKRRRRSADVARVPRANGRAARRAFRQRRAPGRQTARIIGLVIASFAMVVVLFLTAFGSSGTDRTPVALAPSKRLNPAPPPRPQAIALRGPLKLQLPIHQQRVTAIGYHAAASGALALEPVGSQANQGFLRRVARRVFGGGDGGIRYYELGGEGGPSTAVLNVGAPSGTDVYAPVDGTVVGLASHIVSGRKYGARIDVQPSDAPSLVVSITHLRADPALEVGDSVAASRSKIGSVIDFSKVEQQALARYTQDAGNHVAIEVQPAPTLAIP